MYIHPVLATLMLVLLAPAGMAAPPPTHEHVLLARQVGLPAAGSRPEALTVLLHNVSWPAASSPACHFHGEIRDEVIDGSVLAWPQASPWVTPLHVPPGETLALDLPGVEPEPSTERRSVVRHVRLVDYQLGLGPCPLLVQVLDVEDTGGPTSMLIGRFTVGIEKTLPRVASDSRKLAIGFAGGTTNQRGRLSLIAEDQTLLQCRLPEELTGEVALRLDAGGLPTGTGSMPIRNAWPITWKGPAQRQVAIVDIDFAELGATESERADVLLSLHFTGLRPAACDNKLFVGGLSIDNLDSPAGDGTGSTGEDGSTSTADGRPRYFFYTFGAVDSTASAHSSDH